MKNLKSLFECNTKINPYLKLILVAVFCLHLTNKGISQTLPIKTTLQVIDMKSQWNDQIPLENPYKGWYHHFPDNGFHHYTIANDSDLTKFPGMDHLYIRLAWSYLEPVEGQFNWDIIDQMIEKWTTNHLGISFRISCLESTINRHEQQFATPKWVMEAGAKGGFASVEKQNTPWVPIFDDPIFLEKLENFLKVFAQRYDGQSWLRYVDIGSIGPWGEGHSKAPYNYEQRKVHVDLHLKYFKKSQLCISDDFVYSIKDSTERLKMHQYIVEKGITYRDDSPLVKGYLNNHANTYTVRSPEFFADVYRSKPTVFELQHYGSVKNEGNWTATPGSLLAKNAPGKTGPDFFRGSLDLLHATYIGYHGDAHEWLSDNPKLSNELLNQCGYWYFPHSVELPKTVKGGEEMTIAIVWENRGVAPAYNPYDLVLRLKGKDSATINLTSGNEQWLPFKENGTYRKEYKLKIPSLAAGEYNLSLKLYSPQANRTVYLGLNPSIMDKENFYKVGKVKVTAMPAPAKKVLASTPPMGWNSWNTFKKDINEQLFIESANVLISSGLADAGYVYVNIDDGWSGEEANLAIAERFPNGIGYLADYMHKRNLKLGLYTNWRSLGKVERDVKQWAEWNIDLIKNDAWKTPSTDPHWAQMQEAILKTGKPIVHSIHFSDEESNPSNICEISNMWRITNDIQDYYNHESIPDSNKSWAYSTLDIIDRMAEVSHLIKPGCWADADMFEIGNGNQTNDEYKTQFSMWCLLPAPLIMGNDIRTMSNDIKSILMNKEAIDVNQDPAVIPAKRIRKDANTELWSRKLADGSLCVVLLQKTKTKQKVEFTWEEIGLSIDKPAYVRDLWEHKTLGVYTKRFSIPINAHGCAMLKINQNKPL